MNNHVATNRSRIVHGFRTIPAFIAGVIRIAECIQVKLSAAKWSASAAFRFARFRLKAFVNRVNRRIDIRTCRFVRSTCDVQARSSSGSPWALAGDGFRPVRDRDEIRSGDQISAFIRRLTSPAPISWWP